MTIDTRDGFYVGDRVVSVSGSTDTFGALGTVPDGMTGTVTHLIEATPGIGVRWDKKDRRMHTLNGHCKDGYGWYVTADSIQREEAEWDCNPEDISGLLEV